MLAEKDDCEPFLQQGGISEEPLQEVSDGQPVKAPGIADLQPPSADVQPGSSASVHADVVCDPPTSDWAPPLPDESPPPLPDVAMLSSLAEEPEEAPPPPPPLPPPASVLVPSLLPPGIGALQPDQAAQPVLLPPLLPLPSPPVDMSLPPHLRSPDCSISFLASASAAMRRALPHAAEALQSSGEGTDMPPWQLDARQSYQSPGGGTNLPPWQLDARQWYQSPGAGTNLPPWQLNAKQGYQPPGVTARSPPQGLAYGPMSAPNPTGVSMSPGQGARNLPPWVLAAGQKYQSPKGTASPHHQDLADSRAFTPSPERVPMPLEQGDRTPEWTGATQQENGNRTPSPAGAPVILEQSETTPLWPSTAWQQEQLPGLALNGTGISGRSYGNQLPGRPSLVLKHFSPGPTQHQSSMGDGPSSGRVDLLSPSGLSLRHFLSDGPGLFGSGPQQSQHVHAAREMPVHPAFQSDAAWEAYEASWADKEMHAASDMREPRVSCPGAAQQGSKAAPISGEHKPAAKEMPGLPVSHLSTAKQASNAANQAGQPMRGAMPASQVFLSAAQGKQHMHATGEKTFLSVCHPGGVQVGDHAALQPGQPSANHSSHFLDGPGNSAASAAEGRVYQQTAGGHVQQDSAATCRQAGAGLATAAEDQQCIAFAINHSKLLQSKQRKMLASGVSRQDSQAEGSTPKRSAQAETQQLLAQQASEQPEPCSDKSKHARPPVDAHAHQSAKTSQPHSDSSEGVRLMANGHSDRQRAPECSARSRDVRSAANGHSDRQVPEHKHRPAQPQKRMTDQPQDRSAQPQSRSHRPQQQTVGVKRGREEPERKRFETGRRVSCRAPVAPHVKTATKMFPSRPGQKVCAVYMRTGDCKWRMKCKFDHPDWALRKPGAGRGQKALLPDVRIRKDANPSRSRDQTPHSRDPTPRGIDSRSKTERRSSEKAAVRPKADDAPDIWISKDVTPRRPEQTPRSRDRTPRSRDPTPHTRTGLGPGNERLKSERRRSGEPAAAASNNACPDSRDSTSHSRGRRSGSRDETPRTERCSSAKVTVRPSADARPTSRDSTPHRSASCRDPAKAERRSSERNAVRVSNDSVPNGRNQSPHRTRYRSGSWDNARKADRRKSEKVAVRPNTDATRNSRGPPPPRKRCRSASRDERTKADMRRSEKGAVRPDTDALAKSTIPTPHQRDRRSGSRGDTPTAEARCSKKLKARPNADGRANSGAITPLERGAASYSPGHTSASRDKTIKADMRSSEKMSTRPRDDARTNSRSQEDKVPMRPEADECALSRQQELEREVKAWKDQQNKRLQATLSIPHH